MPIHLFARTGHPDFLDLPWDQPLEDWDDPRLVDIPAGLHRHVVRFVRYDEGLYVFKELPKRYAEREYRFLTYLREEGVPVVKAAGVATDRHRKGEPLESVIITKHLPYSLPYRLLFSRRSTHELVDSMLDALVDLLVRIHLVGFMWGDCSLSNTLFRRDARRLAAYLVDTETGELHPSLTDGQRGYELDLAMERTAGELLDLEAQGLVPDGLDPVWFGDQLLERYTAMWDVLTAQETFAASDRDRIRARLNAVNALGYDVGEVEVSAEDGDAEKLRMSLHVVEPNRHRRLLFERVGLRAEESQARVLLADIDAYGAWLRDTFGHDLPRDVLDRRWYQDSYIKALSRIPDDLWGRREGPQVFAEALDHWRWIMGEQGREMPFDEGVDDYVREVLAPAEVEEVVSTEEAFSTTPADTGPLPLPDEGP